MNPESIVKPCQTCPNLEPYVLDINRIRAKIVELIVLQADLNESDEFMFRINRLTDGLEESKKALEEAHAITTGCPGAGEENGEKVCQSPLESNEISDDIF